MFHGSMRPFRAANHVSVHRSLALSANQTSACWTRATLGICLKTDENQITPTVQFITVIKLAGQTVLALRVKAAFDWPATCRVWISQSYYPVTTRPCFKSMFIGHSSRFNMISTTKYEVYTKHLHSQVSAIFLHSQSYSRHCGHLV